MEDNTEILKLNFIFSKYFSNKKITPYKSLCSTYSQNLYNAELLFILIT